MTGFDEEGIFSLRPLFYPDSKIPEYSQYMKFDLCSKNFSVHYETYYNDMCQGGIDRYQNAQKNGKNPKRKVF